MARLYKKYIVSKSDGSPIDEDAEYFVLRLDKGEFVEACRAAARTFAEHVGRRSATFKNDILKLLERVEESNDEDDSM